jgi:hypothetical protein
VSATDETLRSPGRGSITVNVVDRPARITRVRCVLIRKSREARVRLNTLNATGPVGTVAGLTTIPDLLIETVTAVGDAAALAGHGHRLADAR